MKQWRSYCCGIKATDWILSRCGRPVFQPGVLFALFLMLVLVTNSVLADQSYEVLIDPEKAQAEYHRLQRLLGDVQNEMQSDAAQKFLENNPVLLYPSLFGLDEVPGDHLSLLSWCVEQNLPEAVDVVLRSRVSGRLFKDDLNRNFIVSLSNGCAEVFFKHAIHRIDQKTLDLGLVVCATEEAHYWHLEDDDEIGQFLKERLVKRKKRLIDAGAKSGLDSLVWSSLAKPNGLCLIQDAFQRFMGIITYREGVCLVVCEVVTRNDESEHLLVHIIHEDGYPVANGFCFVKHDFVLSDQMGFAQIKGDGKDYAYGVVLLDHDARLPAQKLLYGVGDEQYAVEAIIRLDWYLLDRALNQTANQKWITGNDLRSISFQYYSVKEEGQGAIPEPHGEDKRSDPND